MIKYKKLSSKAGLTIPKDQRLEMGLLSGMAVDLVSTNEGILIRKHVPSCHLCGSIENVVSFRRSELCLDCLNGYLAAAKKERVSA